MFCGWQLLGRGEAGGDLVYRRKLFCSPQREESYVHMNCVAKVTKRKTTAIRVFLNLPAASATTVDFVAPAITTLQVLWFYPS